MKWFTLYKNSDGSLLGHGSTCRDAQTGETRIEHDERQDQKKAWSAETRAWEIKTSSVKLVRVEKVWESLTESEQESFYNLPPDDPYAKQVDAAIARNRRLAGGLVRADSAVLSGMLDLMIAAGVITSARKAEILEGLT